MLLQPPECSHALEQRLELAFPSCIPAPHPFTASLLAAGALELLRPPCASSPQGEKPLAGAMPRGRAPRPTGGSLARLASEQRYSPLSYLSSSRGGRGGGGTKNPGLSEPDAVPGLGTATFTLNRGQVPVGTGASSAPRLGLDGADAGLALLAGPAPVLAGSLGPLGARSSFSGGVGRGLQPQIPQLRGSFVPGTGSGCGCRRGTAALCSPRTWWTGRSLCCGKWATWGRSMMSGCTSPWIGPSASSTRISSRTSPRRHGEPPGVCGGERGAGSHSF